MSALWLHQQQLEGLGACVQALSADQAKEVGLWFARKIESSETSSDFVPISVRSPNMFLGCDAICLFCFHLGSSTFVESTPKIALKGQLAPTGATPTPV